MGKAQKEKMSKLIFSLLNFPHTMLNNQEPKRVHSFVDELFVLNLKLLLDKRIVISVG